MNEHSKVDNSSIFCPMLDVPKDKLTLSLTRKNVIMEMTAG